MSSEKISQLTSGNPALTGDVIPVDRAGENVSVTAGSIAALASSGGNDFTTAGGAFFIGPGLNGTMDSIPNANNTLTFVANTVYVTQFVLQSAYTIRKVSFTYGAVGVNNTGINWVVGIYDSTGAKVLDSGAFAGVNGGTYNGVNPASNTLGTPVNLTAGVYYLAWATSGIPSGQSSAKASVIAGAAGVDSTAIIGANLNVTRIGTAANVMSGSVLPSTLGALTPWGVATVAHAPAAAFEV